MLPSQRNLVCRNCKKRLHVSYSTTIKSRRFIIRCFLLMITVNLMSMSSSKRKLFSNAFLSSRMRSHHRHKQQLSATSYFASIKIIQQRQAYHCYRTFLICNHPRSIQELNIQSTTLLAATATSPTRSKKTTQEYHQQLPSSSSWTTQFYYPVIKGKKQETRTTV